ncbi:TRI56-like protein [Mya arenaria]|uniref:TRI56-like protein n=1 Tax=Mya arenaria TaxID=6604 RepID=A0ABY7DFL3_MYAAR|nr:uncharacterized protein LOC128233871 [Mya arenaria]WAQ95140.1 TRI56-like protein [Mya arenaria]
MSRRDRSPQKGKSRTSPTKERSPGREPDRAKVEDFIKCELCKQMLDGPKTLGCMHSFCRNCTLTYISETVGKGGASSSSIVCPICLQPTPPPPSSKGKEHWADDLPTNEFLSSYLEAVGLKVQNRKCDTCRRQHKSEEASQWCSSCHDALCDECVNFHNALKTTKQHQLVYLTKIRNQPIENIISHPHCKQHGGETVSRYCENHAEIVCEKCVASQHKGCRDVRSLKEAAGAHRPEINGTSSTLGEETKLAKAIYDDRSKSDRTLDDIQARLLQRIQSVRKKINDNLTKCETQIIGELYDVHGKEKATVQAEMKEAQRIKKAAGKVHGLAESSSKYGTECHVLQNMPGTGSQSEHYKGKLASLNGRIRNTKIDFVIDGNLERLMTSVSRLGEIRVTSSSAEMVTSQALRVAKADSDPEDETDIRGSRRTLRSIKSMNSIKSGGSANLYAHLTETFSGRSETDTESCWFTGAVFLPNGSLVLVDRNNSKLKLVDRSCQLVQELHLEQQPYGITVVTANQVAVTLPRENKVEIYDIGASFVLQESFLLNDRGYGICFAVDRFAVLAACASPPAIKVLSRSGEEKHSLCPKDDYHPMFFRPWYVQMDTSGQNMYVSDTHRCHVTCITGTVLKQWVYKDTSLNSPRGLHVTKDKRVLVCGFGSDNVQLLSNDGDLIGDLLARSDDVMGPQDVTLNQAEDKMALTFDPSSGNSDTVRIYSVNL